MKHNFSAGPSILLPEVFEEAASAVKDWNGSGLSILEVSHRGKPFVEALEEARSLVASLLNLNEDYSVLFLQGGASSQFMMVPYNLLPANGTAGYLDTGSWSHKAIKEAKLFGNTEVLGSSEDSNFNFIPKGINAGEDLSYYHITTNNTIFGTEIHDIDNVGCPTVADMSSDIFSREIDGKNFGMIYAGAQKNLGPAGTTMVVVRKSLLGKVDRKIPTMLNYQTHIDKDSSFNTPPVFPIYVCLLSLRRLKEIGLSEIERRNKAKAKLLYDAIDSSSLYSGTAAKEDRSLMNATFVLNNNDLNSEFLTACEHAGIVGLKGHRSVGGFRASMYNALPIASVQVLVDLMKEFERTNG